MIHRSLRIGLLLVLALSMLTMYARKYRKE